MKKKVMLAFLLVLLTHVQPVVAMVDKILIISIDGATFTLIEPWMNEGELPNLARMASEGVVGNLTSTIPPISSIAWASFMTGNNPGRHGIFGWTQCRPGTHEEYIPMGTDIQGKKLWHILSENGMKVIIINVDMTYPPEKVNGILISGVLSPEPSAYPPELAGWLKERGYKVEAKGYKVTPKDEFLQDVYLTTNKRAEIALELMKAQEWDLFLIHFTGGDRIQHYLWRDMEEGSPKYGDEILKYWQHLDGIVGRMLKEVDEETTVIIMSDHGFGGLKKRIHINWWLKEKGYLKLKSDENLWGRFLFWLMGFLKKSGISDLIRNILIFFGVKPSLEVPKPHIDWSQTKAFTCGYYAGQIYLDPALRPEEYEKLRGEIIEQLKELKDPETGRRVLKGVYRVEEIYSGPFLEAGPDILLLPADDYWVVGGWSYPEIFQSRLRESGVHRVDGILLMRGAGIKSRATLRGASIIDLAPTVLHLFSIPIPEMDGRILEEVLG